MELIKKFLRRIRKFLPQKFVKHYINPFLIQGVPLSFNAKKYFESWHKSTISREFSDGITISPDYNPIFSKYHYNSVENSIIEIFAGEELPTDLSVLDIGSGAGHWIDFYYDVFKAKKIVGIEISKYCVDALRAKYKGKDNIEIIEGDISDPKFKFSDKFDIINAIGVMFHIVDDNLWKIALRNISNIINYNGIVIIGGQFGFITQNVQFHKTDEFSTWDDLRQRESKIVLINKRIRSLNFWKKVTAEVGLKMNCVIRTPKKTGINTPENNILVLSLK